MALAKDRNTRRRDGELAYFLMKGGAAAHAGGIAVSDAGYCKPGEKAAGLRVLGRFEESRSNADGADGAAKVLVRRRGTFLFGNAGGGDAVTQAHVGAVCYIEDDETVASASAGRSVAGAVVAVSGDGVWVDLGVGAVKA